MSNNIRNHLNCGEASFILAPVDAAAPAESALRRVLVVDDTPGNLQLAVRRLETSGFTAVGCRYPQEAWQKAETESIDAVVVDLLYDKKPEGAPFIRGLRADPRTAALPIVAVTAWDEDYLLEARRAGADLAISKYDLGSHGMPFLEDALTRGRDAAAPPVLIVEDDPELADLMERLLTCGSGGFYRTRTAVSGKQAAAELDAHPPRLVLLDLSLAGDQDGLAFLAELRQKRACGDLAVIVVSAAPGEALAPVCLEQGADDFIRKPFKNDEFLARVAAVLRRMRPPAPAAQSFGPLRVDWARRVAYVADKPVALTKTEFDILARLLKARGAFVTLETLLAELWGKHYEGSLKLQTNSLHVHLSHLKAKLGPAARFVVNSPGLGYRFEPPARP